MLRSIVWVALMVAFSMSLPSQAVSESQSSEELSMARATFWKLSKSSSLILPNKGWSRILSVVFAGLISKQATISAGVSQKAHSMALLHKRQSDGAGLTVGSEPTSWVTPAVSPAELLRTLRKTQVEAASSVYWQVRQVNWSLWASSSSLG